MIADRAARGKFEFDAVERREALAGEAGEVPRTGAPAGDGVAQDDTHFLLHRTMMFGGAYAEACLYVVVEIAVVMLAIGCASSRYGWAEKLPNDCGAITLRLKRTDDSPRRHGERAGSTEGM